LITFHHVKEIFDGILDYVKYISLQVRLPTFWDNVVEDVLGLILCKKLIGSESQELINIIVEFNPPGTKINKKVE
jgi:hypothetical protein